jgi:myo-inositol-1(or 4)-monophosphatase
MTPLLDTALAAARAAGDVLLERLPHERAVTFKGARDIVTDADFAAQQVVTALIAARFPDHALLAEEGLHAAALRGPRPLWIVDPLDGTTNYARRYPGFAVALALAEAGQVLVGVTHDPQRQETFYAERGQGAFVQHAGQPPQPLHVSPTTGLDQALVGLDWSRDPATRAQVLAALGPVAAACRTVRALGSTALSLAYVAAGRLDAYYQLSARPWDVAAGALLVTEAGGQFTTLAGEPWLLGTGRLAATNGRLHAAFIETLALPNVTP